MNIFNIFKKSKTKTKKELVLGVFPEFIWNGNNWVTEATLPSFENSFEMVFSPDTPRVEEITEVDKGLFKWIIENEEMVHKSLFTFLLKVYPQIKIDYTEGIDSEYLNELLPEVKDLESIANVIKPHTFYIHAIDSVDAPIFGIEAKVPWDLEHGLGILMHGTTILEYGLADISFMNWIARKYKK